MRLPPRSYNVGQASVKRCAVSIMLVLAVCLLFAPFPNVTSQAQQVTSTLGNTATYTLLSRTEGATCTVEYYGTDVHQPIPGPGFTGWQQFLPGYTQLISEEVEGQVHSDHPIDLYIMNLNQLNVWIQNHMPCNLTEGFIAFQSATLDYSYKLSNLPQIIPNFKNIDNNVQGLYLLLINKSVTLTAQVTTSYQISVVYKSGAILATAVLSSQSQFSLTTTTAIATTTSRSAATTTTSIPSSTTTSGAVTTTVVMSSTSSTSSGSGMIEILFSGRLSAIGGIATAGSLLLGWFFKTRKRRFLSGYMTKIDSTYNNYAVNREECKGRLNQMKDDVAEMLKKGKIDDTHFGILEGKISQYLRDLTLERSGTRESGRKGSNEDSA